MALDSLRVPVGADRLGARGALGQVPLVLACVVIAIGALAALRHVDAVTAELLTIAPSLVRVKFNTAACLILLGIGLLTLTPGHIETGRSLRLAIGGFVFALSFGSLLQLIFGIDLRLDQLFVRDATRDYFPPGRIGLNATACLLLAAIALLLIHHSRAQWIAQAVALAAGSIGLMVWIGYLLGVELAARVAMLGVMAKPAAIAIVAFSVGLWLIPTRTGVFQRVALPVRTIALALLALFALLFGVAWLYFQLARTAIRVAEQAFVLQTTPLATVLSNNIDLATEMLTGGRALFAASQEVTRAEWRAFVSAQQSASPVPGLMGVGFSRWLEPEQVRSHEERVRAEGLSSYIVHPAGPRDAYTSIEFLEPFSGQNLRAIGFDMFSEPTRREAMTKAMRTGKAALTAPVQLVQNDGGDAQPGFLIYVPVYAPKENARSQPKLLGFSYSPVRFADFARAAFEQAEKHAGSAPDLAVRLVDAAYPTHVLFAAAADDRTKIPLYERHVRIQLAQREWLLHFSSLPRFDAAYQSFAPIVALYTGTMLSIALVWLALVFLIAYRANANSLAERTNQLGYQVALNRSVTEQMADPVIVVDMTERVTFVNEALLQQLGYSAAEIQQRRASELWANDASDGSSRLRAVYEGQSITNFETVLLASDERRLAVLVSASPLFTAGQQTGAVFVMHDITVRKRAEEALIKSNQELQRFAYVASHDLQSPLRSIASFSQLLHESLKDKLDDQQADWFERIVKNAAKMQALITSLLAYARVGARTAPATRVDLQEIAGSVLELLHSSIAESGARVRCGSLPTVRGDPVLLSQVLQNLVANAIKYRAERQPEVEIQAETSGSYHVISVRDNGIGIPPEHHARIFDLFQRLHTDRRFRGTGVGLAICRRSIEAHGGRLWVESTPGEGSTFRFTLPMAEGS